MNAEAQELPDKRIPLSRRHYITVGALVAIILWFIGATAFVINEFKFAPQQQKIQQFERELADSRLENNTLSTDLLNVKQAYKNLLTSHDAPVALVPSEAATVVGKQITFRWDYKHHSLYQKYFIEIRRISDTNKNSEQQIYKFNVSNPEQRVMHLPRSRLLSGEYIWRIIPGQLSDKEVIQGLGSNYRSFTVYDSMIDRIKKIKTVRVGSSPAFVGTFHYQNDQGELIGFDIVL